MSRRGPVRLTGRELAGHCRSGLSGSKLLPFSERGSAVLFVDLSAIEVTFLAEVIVD